MGQESLQNGWTKNGLDYFSHVIFLKWAILGLSFFIFCLFNTVDS